MVWTQGGRRKHARFHPKVSQGAPQQSPSQPLPPDQAPISHRTRRDATKWAFTKGHTPNPAAIPPIESTSADAGAPPSPKLSVGATSQSPPNSVAAPPVAS